MTGSIQFAVIHSTASAHDKRLRPQQWTLNRPLYVRRWSNKNLRDRSAETESNAASNASRTPLRRIIDYLVFESIVCRADDVTVEAHPEKQQQWRPGKQAAEAFAEPGAPPADLQWRDSFLRHEHLPET